MRYVISVKKLEKEDILRIEKEVERDLFYLEAGGLHVYSTDKLEECGEGFILGHKFFQIGERSFGFDDGYEYGIEDIDRKYDGRYVYIYPDNKIIFTDPLGLGTSYLGKGLIASDKRLLWILGNRFVVYLPPNRKWRLNDDNTFENIGKVIDYGRVGPLDVSPEEAVNEISKYLNYRMGKIARFVNRYVKGVYIAFSGGVDSSITYKLARDKGLNPIPITVCRRGSHDDDVSEVSKKLLEISNKKTYYIDEDMIGYSDIKDIIRIIEDWNLMQVSLSLPLYILMRRLPKKSAVFMGQGSDELYGGYKKYLDILIKYGEKRVIEEMERDVLLSYRVNFSRETKISREFDFILIYPLISPGIVSYVFGLPLYMKIKDYEDKIRKWLIRGVAVKNSIPKEIAYREKKALQYSSKSQFILEKMFGKRKLDKALYNLYLDIIKKYWRGDGN